MSRLFLPRNIEGGNGRAGFGERAASPSYAQPVVPRRQPSRQAAAAARAKEGYELRTLVMRRARHLLATAPH
jgi:hypothetical protein